MAASVYNDMVTNEILDPKECEEYELKYKEVTRVCVLMVIMRLNHALVSIIKEYLRQCI